MFQYNTLIVNLSSSQINDRLSPSKNLLQKYHFNECPLKMMKMALISS